MRILIGWAHQTSPNLGVRVLERGSQDFLRTLWPDAEFEVMNYNARPPAVSWSTRGLAYGWLTNRRGLRDWISSFDLYWDTRAGDSFADIYGMPRHTTMSVLHELATRAGVPTVLAPQTIGPFGSRLANVYAKRNLHRSKLVLARDPRSAEAARALGRPVDVVTSDLVFGVTQPAPQPGNDVLMNVSGLLWNSDDHGDAVNYREQVTTIIDGLLSRGRKVTLLPHVLDSPDRDNDVPVARSLHDSLDGGVSLVIPDDLEHARQIIAGSSLMIGARMHACLNALSTGTPAISMAYSRKFAPLMGAIGWPHTVEISDVDGAARVLAAVDDPHLADRAVEARDTGQRLLAHAAPLVRELAR